MEKHFVILQPAENGRYQFLVDDISDNGQWGATTDISKIKYNLKLLEVDFNLDMQINLPLSTKGISGVVPIGRFITVIKMRKDETEGGMFFHGHNIDLDKVIGILN